ncbi:glycosyltransferase family 4 protein [Faecalicatena contorta]|uniref:glycosyltransferase family 4 protein n=1 Tax=Faecalicatena contorta TaxID=39482 RepID=UPI001F245723|nr:glycosyltransferase family 4 protein [Faecalicatena contorta]MCF2680735.1 glycosyltransferase family 4 protein [Faecalicatena contorta]
MKNICFVDYDMSVTGGVEKVTASLANALCCKYKVHIYGIEETGQLAYELDDRINYVVYSKGLKRLREAIKATFRPFIDFVKKNNIDVVIMMGNYPALIVSFTRFFTSAKYIYCDHGGLMNQWKQKDITAIRFWDGFVAHKVVVLTEKTRKDYIEKFHIRQKKVICIYNWIEREVEEVRKPYDVQSRTILSVGRFGKEKGYDLLVEVARKVLPDNPEWQWHIYGAGETYDETAKKIKEYGLEEQLILKGNVKNVYQLYPEYAFLVLTSYREGLPLVLLEATAVGLPMISFDIETGPNEIIVDGENGFLVPPYEVDKMVERIQLLIEDSKMRLKFSECECVKDKFSQQTILAQWEALIEE